jgi:hypothetical protein
MLLSRGWAQRMEDGMEMGARRTRKETENKNGVIARRGLRVSLWVDGWMEG